jgi:hypothetical protein
VTDFLKALLGNGSVSTPATYMHATIGLPSLGNGEVNTSGNLWNGVFDAVLVIDTTIGEVGRVFYTVRAEKHDSLKQ